MKSTFGLAAASVAALAASLLIPVWLDHRTPTTLPRPTGLYPVGRVIYDWSDDNAPDPLAPNPGTHRELLVWIWYPAASPGRLAPAAYLPPVMRTAVEEDDGPLARLLERDRSKVRTNSFPNAPVSVAQPSYPVVILRGGASREVASYSVLAEDLASHGYIVAGFDAPYRTSALGFPDGRIVRRLRESNIEICVETTEPQRSECISRILGAWTSDMSFFTDRLQVLNRADPGGGRFTGHLDLARLGAFGHSFGGAQAAQFCHDDPRCRAGIDIDGVLFGTATDGGLHRPFMFILSDHIESQNPKAGPFKGQIRSIGTGPAFVIRGANHYFFADDALLKNQFVVRLLRTFGLVRIEGGRELSATAYLVRSFFETQLKGQSDAALAQASQLYPEVHPFR